MNKLLICLVLYLLSSTIQAQTVNRYMVFFKDKDNTPFTVDQPQEYLSDKAIERKGRVINEEDLPVSSSYVSQLTDNNAIILGKTKWFNGALIELNETDFSTIENLSFVKKIEFVAPGDKPITGGRQAFEQVENDDQENGETLAQHDMLSSDLMNTDGFQGQGLLIAVLDGGFRGVDEVSFFKHLEENNQIDDIFNFATSGTDVYSYSDHGTRVLSTISASGPGYEGISPSANFLLYVTEDVSSEYRIEEYNWLLAAERADSIGVDIISTSLGYTDFDDATMNYTHENLDGQTAVITVAAEKAYERGIIVVSSAGNSGNKSWQKVTPPSDGEHVLSVGSVDQFQVKSNFSSIGPINGTWIKPDVMAMGQQTVLVGQLGVVTLGSGTSFAAPQITGLIAGIWEKHPSLSNTELISILKSSADRGGNPDNEYGYGIPSYQAFENLYELQQNLFQQEFLSLFPNPVIDDLLQVRIKDPNIIDDLHVVIYTTDGKKMTEKTAAISWRTNPLLIDLNDLAKGVYIVKITTSEHIVTKRIVKQ